MRGTSRALWTMVALYLTAVPALWAQSLTIPQAPTEENAAWGESVPAEQPAPAKPPSLVKPFGDVLGDLRRLPSWRNMTWLAAGVGAAGAAHLTDAAVTREFSETPFRSFSPGAIVGGTPLQLGASFTAYAIGRATGKPRLTAVGADLIRAQVFAQLVTTGLKQSVRRSRPDGSSFSFPSGHTAVTFASAAVVQKHFGWKVGVPAYVVAAYVAASRVQMKRHYLSDVAFGAALGIVAGRTVTVDRHAIVVTPFASRTGGGIAFTWRGDP